MAKRKQNKKTKLGVLIVSLIIIVAGTIAMIFPLFRSLSFGLDLQGGFEVLYQLESLDGKSKITQDMANATYKTLTRRIDVLGVSEPEIVIEGNDKIRVKLAGIKNPDEARKILGTQASLTFRDTSDNLLMNADVLKSGGAKAARNENGLPVVSLSVKDKDEFYKQTLKVSQSTNNMIVIWLDFDPEKDSFYNEQSRCGQDNSSCLSAATVSQGFASDVIIQGNFTNEEVTNLVELINSGSMPTKLTEISSRTVDASFGEDSLNKTLIAGAIGIGLIIVTLTLIYRLSGLVASISMLIYTFLVFLTFYLVGGVLTLPGIAALVLGIGMAVDSSVISFERIKEELLIGRDLKTAFKEGNKNSFSSILDANLTTLIVAIILFIFGESSVKGFATMLIINIFVTMFTMVFLNRWILSLFVNTGKFDNKYKLLFGLKNTKFENLAKYKKKNEVIVNSNIKFDFVKNRRKFFIVTGLILIIGIIFTCFMGFNLGVDYKGGSSITISANNNLELKTVKKDLKDMEYTVSDINHINNNEKDVYVKIEEVLSKEEINSLSDELNEKYEAKTDIGVVSNIVKKELTKNAILSIIFASIGIIVYVTFRFTFNYAFAGVVALIHDVLFIIVLFSIFRLEVSTIFIAAILSIIGYSINDTIVCFDRIRENLKLMYDDKVKNENELISVVNTSLRQVIVRSIITSITTILPVITLLIFGSHNIYTFNIAMFIGLIIGCYSSVFIAAQLWLELEKKNIGKERKKRFFEIDDDDELDEKVIHGLNK